MNYKELLAFFQKVGELKNIKRSGWLRCEIPNPESVADHTFRTAFMAMILGDILNLNTQKLIKMALIHDLAETVTGDITPYDEITKIEKRKREETGLRELLKDLPNSKIYLNLWIEYEEQKSKEAVILKNIDKLEMAIQAREYQKTFTDKDLSEFTLEADRQISVPEIRVLFEEI